MTSLGSFQAASSIKNTSFEHLGFLNNQGMAIQDGLQDRENYK
jgi:hypothetical protein